MDQCLPFSGYGDSGDIEVTELLFLVDGGGHCWVKRGSYLRASSFMA